MSRAKNTRAADFIEAALGDALAAATETLEAPQSDDLSPAALDALAIENAHRYAAPWLDRIQMRPRLRAYVARAFAREGVAIAREQWERRRPVPAEGGPA